MDSQDPQNPPTNPADLQNQILAQFQAMMNQIAATQASQNEAIQRLQSQLSEGRRDPTRPASPVPGPLEPRNPPENLLGPRPEPYRPKKALPDIPRFSGKRKDFKAWALEARAKIGIDGDSIGNPYAQFYYIYSRMESSAQLFVLAHVQEMDRQGLSTPQNLLQYLESIYIDPNEVARARDRLREEKQKGNESFTFYLPKFERLLAEAELTDAPEGVKISYLEGNISIDLRRALIGREKPQSYVAYVRTLLGLASDLEGLAYYEKRHSTLLRAPAGQFQPRSLPPAPPGPSGPTEGSMDWEPSPRASRGRLTP
jgi:hypothetical protein